MVDRESGEGRGRGAPGKVFLGVSGTPLDRVPSTQAGAWWSPPRDWLSSPLGTPLPLFDTPPSLSEII
jgi:hypothetical protein